MDRRYDRVRRTFDELAEAISERVRVDRLVLFVQGPEGSRRLEKPGTQDVPRATETYIAPLFAGGELVGRLHASRAGESFSPADRECIRTLSRFVAAAAVGITETAESQQMLGEAEVLLEIGRATATLLRPQEVAARATAVIERIVTKPHQFSVFVVSEDGKQLELLIAHLLDPSLLPLLEAAKFPTAELPEPRRTAFRDGRSVYCADVLEEPTLQAHQRERSMMFGVRTLLDIPIQAGGTVLGLLEVSHPRPNTPFAPQQRRLLEGIADQMALSLRNARLATENARRLDELRALSRRVWSVQEEERRRIARELHDEAGQSMTALKLNLDLARKEGDAELMRGRLAKAATLAGEVLEELRRIARDLRPASLDDLGLVPAVRALVDGFGKRLGIASAFESRGPLPAPDGDTAATVYRFVQEALTNVARHSGAATVTVTLDVAPDALRVQVVDDGVGFDPLQSITEGRLGILGMRERARILGGRVYLESKPGGGARLELELPAAVKMQQGRGEG